jgi:hypothetical protein
MNARYRAWQFVRAIRVRVCAMAVDDHLAADYLPPDALRLFQAMARYDRQHALAVLQSLESQGLDDPDLMAAALLHDVGKTGSPGGRVRLWHRVAAVLAQAMWPALLARVARNEPGSWRRPFYLQLHHADVSARLAKMAGCSARTVELIRQHEEPVAQNEDPFLDALRAADATN